MRTNPLAGRTGVWLRELADTGEGTFPAVLDTLRDFGGYDLLVMKVADGLTWQGQIDPSTPIRSVDDVVQLSALCAARGVALCPVVVPRGADVTGEAILHGTIARNVGCLMTDIEGYAGFWDKAPASRIPEYTARLRQTAGDAYLVNQPDPRAVTDTRVVETAGDFDAVCAQHYVGWDVGDVHWTDVDLEVKRFTTLHALFRESYVTLYGVNRIDLAAAFWERVRGRALGFHAFAFGQMNADQLRFFGGLPRVEVLKPEPVNYRKAAVSALTAIVQQANDDLARAQVSHDLRVADAQKKLAALGDG